MRENAQKCDTWLLHGKKVRFNDAFSEVLNGKQAQYEDNLCSKKIRKGEKGQAKKIKKRKAQRRKSLSQNFEFCACPSRNVENKNATLVERKARCHVVNAFLSRLKLVWLISSLKISKMCKKCVSGKKLSESMG